MEAYISVKRFQKALGEHLKTIQEFSHVFDALDATPEEDVAPVIHAAWIPYNEEHAKCSTCGNVIDLHSGKTHKFCDECGSLMDIA